MAQMVLPQKRESPKSPTSPTFEQLLREEEGSWWSTTNSAKEGHSHHHIKKSVLTKVKEKAKKIRHSLSLKKRHHEDENTMPTWGVCLEDDEDEDEEEDAEYLGAPMYESELAPESYKATARHHPRAIPVISDKHVLPTIAPENKNKNEDSLSSANSTKQTQTQDLDKLSSTSTLHETITEAVSQKLSPSLQTVTSTVFQATHSIASKIQGLALNSTTEPSQTNNSNINSSQVSSENGSLAQTSSLASSEAGKNVSSVGDRRIWDKGVSVKGYLLSKFEPGEEDRALSRAISDAVSPRSREAPGEHQTSVVDMVREAVTSLLRNNDQAQSPPSKPAELTRSDSKTSSCSSVPVSTDAHEVVEEKVHGRILHTN